MVVTLLFFSSLETHRCVRLGRWWVTEAGRSPPASPPPDTGYSTGGDAPQNTQNTQNSQNTQIQTHKIHKMRSTPGQRPTRMLLKIHDLKPSNMQVYQNKTPNKPYGGAKAIKINSYHNQLNCPESFGNQWLDDKDGVDKKLCQRSS